MRKQRYTPYFLDFNYERRTYNHIGKDYGNRRSANKGWLGNFFRWYRKRIYNRKESKYKFCDTYEEWKLYLAEREFGNVYNKKNVIRLLCKRKRNFEKLYEAIKTIIIPIYIALYSALIAIMNKFSTEKEAAEARSGDLMLLYTIFLTLFIIIISTGWIFHYKNNIYFYTDYIDCLNNE